MKKILFLMLVIISAFFPSCKEDKEEEIKVSDVVGTWVTTALQDKNGQWIDVSSLDMLYFRCYASFNENGTYRGWGYLGEGKGTWMLKKGTITTYVDGVLFITYSDIVLDGDKMEGVMSGTRGDAKMAFKAIKR